MENAKRESYKNEKQKMLGQGSGKKSMISQDAKGLFTHGE